LLQCVGAVRAAREARAGAGEVGRDDDVAADREVAEEWCVCGGVDRVADVGAVVAG
jgi:hypothetical protein